eukprot:scaffold27841_cov34-Cyclotella_meneghiniana.AAC.2
MEAQSTAPASRPFVDSSVVVMVVFGGRLAYGGGHHGFEVVVGRRVGEFTSVSTVTLWRLSEEQIVSCPLVPKGAHIPSPLPIQYQFASLECILALEYDHIACGGEDDTTTITIDPSHRIHRWLFSLRIGSLVKASLNIDNDDPDLREYSKKRHNLCILPSFNPGEPTAPSDTTHNTFVQLSSTISNLCESNNNANQLNALNFQRLAKNDAKKKDRIKKFIDEDTLKCIKMAGSPDGENLLVDLPPEFIKSFNKETVDAFGKD